jgi:cytidylate kinase
MYRAVTLYAQRNNLLDANETIKVTMMEDISLSYTYNEDTDHYDIILNGENVEREIRQTSLALQLHKIVGVT